MYRQNSGFGSGMHRREFQPGSQNRYQNGRNFSTGRMEDQQDQYQNPDQEEINNPTPEPIPQTSQDPQHNGSYIVIPPNQTKRNKLLTMANKEEEEYNHLIESRRSGPIHLTPQKLGGQTSEAKARQQQQLIQSQSKYQKKFQRDEYIRKQKEEEEAKIQHKKDIQRKKAEKLEEKRRLEETERRERWHEEMLKKNSEFLDKFSHPVNSSSPSISYGKQACAWENSHIKEEQDWNEYTDEERAFQLALKESMKTKMEEDKRREEMEKNRPCQASLNSYRQQLMEEEERKLHKMKEEHNRKKMEEERRRQEMEKTQARQKFYSFYKQLKEEEERKLQDMKNEQRRKSELLEVKKAEEERERQLSQQEERRRINNAFLDKLQTQNTRQHEYNGESNTWA